MMTLEMGKTLRSAKAEAIKCAKGFRYYAEQRREAAGRRAGRGVEGRRQARLHTVAAARRGAGRDAVELPFWQADAVRRASADGPRRRPAQARLQRAAAARCSCPRRSPEAASRKPASGRLLMASKAVEAVLLDRTGMAAGRLTGSEAAGRVGGGHRRRGDQTSGDGTRRQRRLHREAVGRPRRGGKDRGHRADGQQRPKLHRGKAVHRADRHPRRVRGQGGRAMGAFKVGDRTPGHRLGPLAKASGRDQIAQQVDDAGAARARCASAARLPTGGLVLSAHGRHRHQPGQCALHRRGVRAGRLDVAIRRGAAAGRLSSHVLCRSRRDRLRRMAAPAAACAAARKKSSQ